MPSSRLPTAAMLLQVALIAGSLWFGIAFHGGSFGSDTIRFAVALGLLSSAAALAAWYAGALRAADWWRPWLLFAGLFCAWCLVALSWHPSLYQGATTLAKLVALPLAALSLALPGDARRTWPWLLGILVATALGMAAWGLVELFRDAAVARAGFLNKNVFAGFLNLVVLVLAAYYVVGRATWVRVVLLVAIAIMLLAINGAYSRGALIGLAAGLALLALANRRRLQPAPGGGRVWHVALLAVLGFVAVWQLAPTGGASMVERTARDLANPTRLHGRAQIWQAGASLVSEAPMRGVGLGMFWLRYPAVRDAADNSAGFNVHNDYLQLAIESGLVGLLLALLAAAFFVRDRLPSAERDDGLERAGLLAALAAVAVQAIFTELLFLVPILTVLGLYVGRLLHARSDDAQPAVRLHPAVRAVVVLVLLLPLWPLARLALAAASYEAALAAFSAGDAKQASLLLQRADAQQPGVDSVYIAHADLYLKRLAAAAASADAAAVDPAELAQAAGLLTRAVAANPYRTEVAFMQGQLALYGAVDARGVAAAEAHLIRALALDPRHLQARVALATLYNATGRSAAAHSTLEAGRPYRYRDSLEVVDYLIKLAQTSLDAGDTDQGLATAQRANAVLRRMDVDLDVVALLRERYALP